MLFSMGAFFVLIAFVYRWWGIRPALFAAWFLAWSTFDLYYAQEGRMYTLLAFLWLLSLLLMVEGFHGNSKAFLYWGVVNSLLAWVHFYGILVAGVHIVLAVFACCIGFYNSNQPPGERRSTRFRAEHLFPGNWFLSKSDKVRLGLGIGISLLSVVPVLMFVFKLQSKGAGGAWVPQWKDLVDLVNLISVGIGTARGHFLNGENLSIPLFSSFSRMVWLFVGLVSSGGFVLYGLVSVWKTDQRQRLMVVFSVLSAVLPLLVVFGYTFVFRKQLWAYKPFLGIAYLYAMWVGIGLHQIDSQTIRKVGVIVIFLVGAIMMIPYYSGWRKSDEGDAFKKIQWRSQSNAVVLAKTYTFPVAFYYLGDDATVWGLRESDEGTKVVEVNYRDSLFGGYELLDCDKLSKMHVSNLYFYGFDCGEDEMREGIPICLREKSLWQYQGNTWVKLP